LPISKQMSACLLLLDALLLLRLLEGGLRVVIVRMEGALNEFL